MSIQRNVLLRFCLSYIKNGNTNDAPRTLAPQIVESLGASSSEGEGVDEDVDVGVGEGETEIEVWC